MYYVILSCRASCIIGVYLYIIIPMHVRIIYLIIILLSFKIKRVGGGRVRCDCASARCAQQARRTYIRRRRNNIIILCIIIIRAYNIIILYYRRTGSRRRAHSAGNVRRRLRRYYDITTTCVPCYKRDARAPQG